MCNSGIMCDFKLGVTVRALINIMLHNPITAHCVFLLLFVPKYEITCGVTGYPANSLLVITR